MTDADTETTRPAQESTDDSAAQPSDETDTVQPSDERHAVQPSDKTLGTVVESNSQMDYAVEVYRERDRDDPPGAADYEFGQPVYARTRVAGSEYALVGVIYDSVLVAPEQGRETPRLSTPDEDVFVPSYVDERQTILGVAALGYAELAGDSGGSATDESRPAQFVSVDQRMPRWTLDVDDRMNKLSPSGFRRFHEGPDGVQLQYYDRLLSTAGSFGAEVALSIVDRLRAAGNGDDAELLDVIERQIRWNAATDRGVVR